MIPIIYYHEQDMQMGDLLSAYNVTLTDCERGHVCSLLEDYMTNLARWEKPTIIDLHTIWLVLNGPDAVGNLHFALKG